MSQQRTGAGCLVVEPEASPQIFDDLWGRFAPPQSPGDSTRRRPCGAGTGLTHSELLGLTPQATRLNPCGVEELNKEPAGGWLFARHSLSDPSHPQNASEFCSVATLRKLASPVRWCVTLALHASYNIVTTYNYIVIIGPGPWRWVPVVRQDDDRDCEEFWGLAALDRQAPVAYGGPLPEGEEARIAMAAI